MAGAGPCAQQCYAQDLLSLSHALSRLSAPTPPALPYIRTHVRAALDLFRTGRPTSDHDPDQGGAVVRYLDSRAGLEQAELEASVNQFLFGGPGVAEWGAGAGAGVLGPALQGATELALYLLCCPQSEPLGDASLLSQLREILFRARLLQRHCLKGLRAQVGTRSPAVEPLASAYRLLTRLHAALPAEPPQDVLDEIALLEYQVDVFQLSLVMPSRGYLAALAALPAPAAPAAPASLPPQVYTHGTEQPPSLRHAPHPGLLPPLHPRDPLLYHHTHPLSPERHCTRCWAVRPVQGGKPGGWEHWARRCPCGGHWALSPPSAAQLAA